MHVLKEIAALRDEMTAWRQDIHQNPEMGLKVHRTADKVSALLQGWGVEVQRICDTGVVGILHGRGGAGGRSIGLRADMDALRITEDNDLPYRSQRKGVMHACGHDGHTAMLLGAAKHLARTRDFDGTVYFIFQPAEEGLDGAAVDATGGAEWMIKNDFFTRFPCDEIYAIHNSSAVELGRFTTRAGAMLAASDRYKVMFTGRGGHAALPEETDDTLGAALAAVQQLRTYARTALRSRDPDALVAVCPFHTGSESLNVVSDKTWFGGTARFFDMAARGEFRTAFRDIIGDTARDFGVEAAIEYNRGYPVLVNAPSGVAAVARAAAAVAGADSVDVNIQPMRPSEDFAYFLQQRPGAMVTLGIRDGDDFRAPVHSPQYKFNDAALPVGASFWVTLVRQVLSGGGVSPAPRPACTL